jgi:hypothetical protein
MIKGGGGGRDIWQTFKEKKASALGKGRVALLALPCFEVHRAQGHYRGCLEKGSPLGPSMLWGAPLCLRDGLMVLIFWLCCHRRALWYSYSDYAVIQGPNGTHILIMPSSKGLMGTHIWIMLSSKGLMVLIFGLCCRPRALPSAKHC